MHTWEYIKMPDDTFNSLSGILGSAESAEKASRNIHLSTPFPGFDWKAWMPQIVDFSFQLPFRDSRGRDGAAARRWGSFNSLSGIQAGPTSPTTSPTLSTPFPGFRNESPRVHPEGPLSTPFPGFNILMARASSPILSAFNSLSGIQEEQEIQSLLEKIDTFNSLSGIQEGGQIHILQVQATFQLPFRDSLGRGSRRSLVGMALSTPFPGFTTP